MRSVGCMCVSRIEDMVLTPACSSMTMGRLSGEWSKTQVPMMVNLRQKTMETTEQRVVAPSGLVRKHRCEQLDHQAGQVAEEGEH